MTTLVRENLDYTPLNMAIWRDAYTYLDMTPQGQDYLVAIREMLTGGATPDGVKAHMLREVGTDRMGLVLRCGQAAWYIWHKFMEVEIEQDKEQVVVSLKTTNPLKQQKVGI